MLRVLGPVYTDDPAEQELVDDVIAAGETTVYALCPQGHVAATFPREGREHHDHQPCPGAWWVEA
jgi:hypothetical protein